MAYLVELSRKAETEITETFAWKGENISLEAASRWYQGLIQAVTSLEELPKRCPLAPDNAVFPEEIRQLFYGRGRDVYRILFVIRGVTVYVLHVRHASQPPLSTEDGE